MVAGVTARRKPSLAASLRRWAAWATGLTAPERPISPKKTTSGGRGRPRDLQPARDAQIDVMHAELEAAVRLEHGEHHGEAVLLPADHRAPRRAEGARGDERLELDEEGARAFHAGEDRRAGRRMVA